MEAPYQRIVAELRDRIARGELRPGDPVPSTRQITQRWGVAMATATKVIATLRTAGLVDTRPGVGTVVRSPSAQQAPIPQATPPQATPPQATPLRATPPHAVPTRAVPSRVVPPRAPSPRASPPRAVSPRATPPRAIPSRAAPPRQQDLSRDRVVRAAIALADAEGLAALSMRRVATELGVATMSLYRHVPGKDELVLLMVDAVAAEEPLPRQPPAGWRERLELAARSMWRMFRRHPWAAEALSMTRPRVTPNLLGYAEWSLSTLRGLGFGVDDMMHTHLALFGHVRGLAMSLQSEVHAQQDTGMTNDEWIQTQESNMDRALASGRFPALAYIVRQQFDYDLDAVFEFGLRRLLDGIGMMVRA